MLYLYNVYWKSKLGDEHTTSVVANDAQEAILLLRAHKREAERVTSVFQGKAVDIGRTQP